MITLKIASAIDVPAIREIAFKTWPNTYGEILSVEQLNYMLDNFYSMNSLEQQFDNGQVWHQLGTEYYSVQPGERHYIKRGTLNSFLMGSDDSRKAIRVRREQ